MARNFLITGGTGFLGSALARRLVAGGHYVRIFDDNSRGAPRRLADIGSGLELIQGDVRDGESVSKAAFGADIVVHLAAINGTQFFYSKPELVLDVGIRGILSVIDACRTNKVRDLIVASSSEVYQTPPHIPTDETAPLIVPDVLNPRYSYGGSKIISELLALNFGRTSFGRVTIFRPHNVYGPDMAWEHVVPQFCLRAMDLIALHPTGPLPFPIQGDGTQTRAFIYIDDMIDGLLTIIEKGGHLEVYHVGNPDEVTIADVARLVVRELGRDVEIQPSILPTGSTPRRCPDIDKLKKLGFVPRVRFATGIHETVAWYRKNRHLRPVVQ
jgi:dTDP-glucose 4,6-dehydratase/UDP-glucose 4-epimerase